MSDEIAILRDGRLIQQAAPHTLYERPATRFVADFLGRSNFLPGRVERVTPQGFSYRCGPHLLVQHGPGPVAGEAVLITLRPEKLRLTQPGDAAGNRLPGRVIGLSYLGEATQIRVDVDGIGRLAVNQPTGYGQMVEPGAAIEVGWDHDASVPVAEDHA